MTLTLISCPRHRLALGGAALPCVQVTLLASTDGGRGWGPARPPPAHVVAASPQNFTAGGNRMGFRSPSNIGHNCTVAKNNNWKSEQVLHHVMLQSVAQLVVSTPSSVTSLISRR